MTQTPAEQCGDLLLRDRDGHWTYQFAVTVDDLRQDVTLVIRGADLLSSTGRQILLARMLGRTSSAGFPASSAHHEPTGEKLSKSAGDTGVRELRARGLGPETSSAARQRPSASSTHRESVSRALRSIGASVVCTLCPDLEPVPLTFDFSVLSLR